MRKIIENGQGTMDNGQLTMDNSELSKGWEIKKLGEVCEILDNLRTPITKRDRIEGNYPYYGATGILSYINDFIFNEKLVLIGEDGAKWESGDNSSFIVNGKYWVNNHAHVIRPKRDIILDEWIVYFLNYTNLLEYVTGMTVPKLNQGNLKQIQIPLPPLPEQKRIVSILDRAFEAIDKTKANAEQNLKNAKELFESYLQGVFDNKGDDWEEKKLGEVCVINPKKSEVNNLPENLLVSFLPMKDLGIAQNQINPIITKPLSEVKGSYTYFRNEDVLLAKVTPCFENGKLGIAKNLKNKIGFGSSEYIVFRPKNKILSEYIFYILSNPKFRNKGKELMFGAVGLKRLSKDYVQNFVTPLPSLDEQLQIVKRLYTLSSKTKKLESIYQQKINDLEELKKSILQKAFAGELI